MCKDVQFVSSAQVHMLTYRRIASLQATGLGTGSEAAGAEPPSPSQPLSPLHGVQRATKKNKKKSNPEGETQKPHLERLHTAIP